MQFNIEAIFELIPVAPFLRVLTVLDSNDAKNLLALKEHLSSVDGELDIISYQPLSSEIKALSKTTLKEVDSYKTLFETDNRAYEFTLLIETIQKVEDKLRFFRQLYHTLENSGNFICLVNKVEVDKEEIKELLAEVNFVAVNDIDFFETHHIITAKKMHGWGGGM